MAYDFITAKEAAEMIQNGDTLGLSGFTAPGNPKAITEEVALKAAREHEQGREFKVNIFTGASTNDHVDGMLARNNAINMRAPIRTLPTCANASILTTRTISTAICRKWRRKRAMDSTARPI